MLTWDSGTFKFLVISSLFFLFAINSLVKRKAKVLYPPGPKGLPIVGSILDVPVERFWLKYDQWIKEYGDIISLNMLGKRFIILGSLKRVNDLFETRSSIYSSRPRLVMVAEMMHWDFMMSFQTYGPWWRRHRKMFHDHFHPNVVEKYIPTQERDTRILLLRLLESPEDFVSHIRLAFAATIMDVSYGIKVQSKDDIFVKTVEEAVHGLDLAAVPGSFLVDLIPALKIIPHWFPGSNFKKIAYHYSRVNSRMENLPWEHVKKSMKEGTAVPSLSTALIEALPDESDPRYKEELQISISTAAIAYAAGADTTLSGVLVFLMAMVLYPDAQKRAQREIDAIVGSNRLPEFADRSSLHCIEAIVKETTRWQPVSPMAIAHAASEDDFYDGYFIPKGTIVLGNSWSILHDPDVYPDPEEFKPERFMKDGKIDPSVRNPHVAAFGYGRRICPGRHFSDNSLYLLVAAILAVFDIGPALDAGGNPIKFKPEMTGGLLSTPRPFKCSIVPRSPAAEILIRESQDLE